MQRILLVVVVLLIVWRILASIGRRLSEKAPGADSVHRVRNLRARRQVVDGRRQPRFLQRRLPSSGARIVKAWARLIRAPS
ncbi:MAG: hypothetical protein IFK92_11225 [Acidobacteria bacterium]|nr:hypothetical protein [Candidatus Sulfomarinibacter kjeldsenii]